MFHIFFIYSQYKRYFWIFVEDPVCNKYTFLFLISNRFFSGGFFDLNHWGISVFFPWAVAFPFWKRGGGEIGNGKESRKGKDGEREKREQQR